MKIRVAVLTGHEHRAVVQAVETAWRTLVTSDMSERDKLRAGILLDALFSLRQATTHDTTHNQEAPEWQTPHTESEANTESLSAHPSTNDPSPT